MNNPKLYLIPVTLGETPLNRVIPDYNNQIVSSIKYFIVENIRSARRFLKLVDKEIDIDSLTFYELNKHTDMTQIQSYLAPIKKGESIGVLSEAGCPAIADPGKDIVEIAQSIGCTVVPLVGPTSIILSLMASGFNGQNFTFNGYLPIDDKERKNKFKLFETRILQHNETQIFIETPFRNKKLIDEIIKTCNPSLKLCIACNVTCDDEYIKTKKIKEWKSSLPDIQKKNSIFLLYK